MKIMYHKSSKFQKKPIRNNWENKQMVEDAERPNYTKNQDVKTLLINKSLKGLPQSSYAVKVDPYTEMLPQARPYPIVDKLNRIMGASYGGDDNLTGGNITQYANSATSKFLKVFDSAAQSIGLNYRYLPIMATDTHRGSAMVDEMRKAIAEIVSSLNATTFKEQNIFNYVIETDLPMGSAPTTKITINDQQVDVYYKLEDVIYAYCIEYQLILQSVAMVYNQFNANRSKMGTMIRMSWNREVPLLNSYFGLLKKKSFLSLFDSLSAALEGEYVDQDWMRQANLFTLGTSRKSNSMTEPILEVIAYHNLPTKFKAHVMTDNTATTYVATIYDYANMKYTPAGETQAVSFDEAVKQACQYLSLHDTLRWARQVNNNKSQETETTHFNKIKTIIDVMTYCITYFKTNVNDLRTVLDIMARIGVVKWNKGTRLSIIPDTDIEIMQNLIINNVLELLYSGSPKMYFNDTTKRWRSFVVLDLYYGIPEYADKMGGAFLAFSTKELTLGTSSDSNVDYLPIAFNKSSTSLQVLNRVGDVVTVDYEDVVMSDSKIYSRLVPLTSQDAYKIRVPKVTGVTDKILSSFIYRFLIQVFGCGNVDGDYILKDESLEIYEYEVEDFTNEVITYCRDKGPFKVTLQNENKIGFLAYSASK